MERRRLPLGIATALIACIACASGAAPASADNGNSWTANGATACEKYLTKDVLAAIYSSPPGPAARDDANSCHAGGLYITLKVADVALFKQELPNIPFAHSMAGVGDAALWNHAGGFSAVKSPNRGCDISAIVGQPPKIHDEALAQKLGEICNKLFALP
jgi:hypothetical protein